MLNYQRVYHPTLPITRLPRPPPLPPAPPPTAHSPPSAADLRRRRPSSGARRRHRAPGRPSSHPWPQGAMAGDGWGWLGIRLGMGWGDVWGEVRLGGELVWGMLGLMFSEISEMFCPTFRSQDRFFEGGSRPPGRHWVLRDARVSQSDLMVLPCTWTGAA